jgi:hypothetical protein
MYVYLKCLLANWNSLVLLNVAVCGQKGKCSEAQVLQVKTQRKANGVLSICPYVLETSVWSHRMIKVKNENNPAVRGYIGI